MKSSLALILLMLTSTTYGMGAIRAAISNLPPVVITNAPPPAPEPLPQPEPVPPVVSPPQPPSTHPFVGRRVTTHRIAKDVLDWKETATITKATFSGNKLTTSGTFPKWPCFDISGEPMQGNFALAVEQPDGSIVLGTWDWDRCPHQKVKSPGHNFIEPEHQFFNLAPGRRVWWFITARSRDGQRTVKERSNFVADVWK